MPSPAFSPPPRWLDTAIGYQIYPQSFQDSNGDGIGDLPGILNRAGYLSELGINFVWINPFYDSPFLDAGYDVRDYRKVAPRYGTLDDFKDLVKELHGRGIRVMLDLVPGHTSIDHDWFLESCKAEKNAYTERYVWTNGMYRKPTGKLAGAGHLQGYGEREGSVAYNFFWSQPKLNYGVLEPDPQCPWEMPFDHPEVQTLWRDMFDIIRFWLDLGADGFRIDSAKSVCPDRPPLGSGTFYRRLREMFDKDYPEAALLTEWGWPCDALACGIHADFLLHNNKAFNALFSLPGWENHYTEPFFSSNGGDIGEFLGHYLPHYEQRNGGLISIMTGNHDYKRAATGRTTGQLKVLFAFLLTMPGMPVIYYGDELGIPFVDGLTSKEGGFRRTGARTPMQWNGVGGFSNAPIKRWYLPQHEDVSRINVEAQRADEASLLNQVRKVIALRKEEPALNAHAAWTPLNDSGSAFAYTRGEGSDRLLVVLNPPQHENVVELPADFADTELTPLLSDGCRVENGRAILQPEAWGIFKIG